MAWFEISMLLLWSVVLATSGSYLVRSLTKISKFLRLEEFSTGFIIMAVATSIPEIFIGVYSAVSKNPSLSLGNVIGSNVIDLTLIAGVVILLSGGKIKIKSKKIVEDSFYMSLIALLPLLLLFMGQTLTRLDGFFLILVFGLFMRKKILESRKFRKRYKSNIKRKEVVITALIFVTSLITLLISSKLVVNYAELISVEFLLPPILIGIILVAVGTSLPELVFGTRASLSKHPELSLGDLTGSVIVNSTLVLGITAMIYPVKTDIFLFFASGFFMFIVTFLFASFAESGHELDWKEGCSLIFLYIFFLMLEFFIKFAPK